MRLTRSPARPAPTGTEVTSAIAAVDRTDLTGSWSPSRIPERDGSWSLLRWCYPSVPGMPLRCPLWIFAAGGGGGVDGLADAHRPLVVGGQAGPLDGAGRAERAEERLGGGSVFGPHGAVVLVVGGLRAAGGVAHVRHGRAGVLRWAAGQPVTQ